MSTAHMCTNHHESRFVRFISLIAHKYQYVPHKAVAEVSKIANYRRLVAVNHGSQSKSIDGSKSGWRQRSVVLVVVVIVVAM